MKKKMKSFVSVVYDRKRRLEKTGKGKVELHIHLNGNERKYITIKDCTPYEWVRYQKSPELRTQILVYQSIAENMLKCCEEMTIDNYNRHLGLPPKRENKKSLERRKRLNSKRGFIEFIEEEMEKENVLPDTKRKRMVVLRAMERYGELSCFADVTPENVKGFDDFLRREDRTRTDVALYNYHKFVRKYSRLAYQLEYISTYPYGSPLCKFKKGESKERKALTEEELQVIINLKGLTIGEEHARDLFIFSAFTGLAYADNQNFDFFSMTEKLGDMYYIDGERLKTGHSFFTPILPPAMEILKKYDYQLPRMSNQKMNQFLHLVEARAKLRKPMTSHIARHSFATIALNHDIPIEDVAKMLGHTNINTTKIYAKIMTKTIERHATNMAASMSKKFR